MRRRLLAVAATLAVLAGCAGRVPTSDPDDDLTWTLLSYEPGTDTWTTWPAPSGLARPSLVGHGDLLVAYPGTDEHGSQPDQVLDPATGRWTELPDDPIGPAFDRVTTSTPHGLVLTARSCPRVSSRCWPGSPRMDDVRVVTWVDHERRRSNTGELIERLAAAWNLGERED